VAFLKELLALAHDVVAIDRERPPPVEPVERGKAALTELFEEARNDETPIVVERIVNDIDDIVRVVRFDGWQSTHGGEREVKRALRRTLLKYRLHENVDLFDRAYQYIRKHY
jgi:type I restriction enzyme R subunit